MRDYTPFTQQTRISDEELKEKVYYLLNNQKKEDTPIPIPK